MDGKTKVATAVIAGLAVGAAAWYLFSTEKGKETADKWLSSLKDAGDSLNDLKSKAADTIAQLAGKADKYASQANTFAGNVKSEANGVY